MLILKEDAMKHNFRMRRLCFFDYESKAFLSRRKHPFMLSQNVRN
ncbi:hypothetical protein KIS1582_4098 [Cytobacillus firmus]|uniref:Uncharacterized protein n=1 Tax=Cytobacillus firmus TaxID=1399 RepID=A0A800MTE5_CYTFI|nr:hypothetical protein KIS1582_4098 [Cytobacillus firmus]